jgi:hypothetical protein
LRISAATSSGRSACRARWLTAPTVGEDVEADALLIADHDG